MARRSAIAALLGVALMLLPACRARAMWSGAFFTRDGMLQVVSEEPSCACLSLTNRSEATIFVRSALRGSTLGAAVINAKETRRFRFDWAGTGSEDFYIIESMDGDGRVLNSSRVLGVDVRPLECDARTCVFDTLLLNAAIEAP